MRTLDPTELSAAQGGDRDALDRVLRHSRQHLRRYAEYHCAINDVEDAVQESLITLSRRLADLRVLECFVSWAFRIVKRECNRLKRAGCQWRHEEIREELLPAAHRDDLELRGDCAAALSALPPHYREVVLLRDLQGLSITEMAAQLQTTPETIKARLHRARALARTYLA